MARWATENFPQKKKPWHSTKPSDTFHIVSLTLPLKLTVASRLWTLGVLWASRGVKNLDARGVSKDWLTLTTRLLILILVLVDSRSISSPNIDAP